MARVNPKRPEELDTAVHEHHGRVIGVIAARGGLGVSTLATNLAGAFYSRTHKDVILAEIIPGRGSIGWDLGSPNHKELNELLMGTAAEISREKVDSMLVAHGSGLRLLLSSENPHDIRLTDRINQVELLVLALATLANYVVLDLGSALLPYVDKILAHCTDRIVITEGIPSTIALTKSIIEELGKLNIDPAGITVVLNNRIRTEAQMPSMEVQENLGHSITATLTPAPEMFISAARMHTPAVLSQPTTLTSQQILKVADQILEREKAK